MAVNNSNNTIQLTRSVVQSDGAGQLISSNGTDGQLLIASVGAQAVWNNLTSTGGTITVTQGPGTINIESNGTTPAIAITFSAVQTSSVTLSAGVTYTLGTSSILTEVFDQVNNFYPGDGAGTAASFTAPQTAKYHLAFQMTITSAGAFNLDQYNFAIITSNRTYAQTFNYPGPSPSSRPCYGINGAFDMDMGDTATFTVLMNTIPSSAQLLGSAITTPRTWVSGLLIGG